MSKITYSEVENHLSKIQANLKETLRQIEDCFISARDSDDDASKLPIYLTKWRVKTPSSVYLKTKRKEHKYESLDEITDYGGIRVLCLFEQNIIEAHKFIINKLLEQESMELELVEFSTFNWDEEGRYKLEEVVRDAEKGPTIDGDNGSKDSGYRSVHYIVKNNTYKNPISVEIQLRTLLQDAWGELEHSLAYKKGSIHPHIKKSFTLLSQDLATNDQLIAHLLEISRHEQVTDVSRSRLSGPYEIFSYSEELDSARFSEGSELHSLRLDYDQYTKENSKNKNKEWTNIAKEKLDSIKKKVNLKEIELDIKFKYWLDMEDAYLKFQKGELEDAEKSYQEIIELGEDKNGICSYVTYFRYGEVLFKQGKITLALVAFDQAEELCETAKPETPELQRRNEIEFYRIKYKLAHIYWQLGEEYHRIALKVMKEAEVLFPKVEQYFDGDKTTEQAALWNNLCWYGLENYLNSKEESFFEEAKTYFEEITNNLDRDLTPNTNIFDTCAWFSFQAYKKFSSENKYSEAKDWLKKAKDFCHRMLYEELPTRSTAAFLSFNMQKNHFEEIMSEEP